MKKTVNQEIAGLIKSVGVPAVHPVECPLAVQTLQQLQCLTAVGATRQHDHFQGLQWINELITKVDLEN